MRRRVVRRPYLLLHHERYGAAAPMRRPAAPGLVDGEEAVVGQDAKPGLVERREVGAA